MNMKQLNCHSYIYTLFPYNYSTGKILLFVNKIKLLLFQILTPCDISLYMKTPTGQGAHMDIQTSDLILNISPATIRTMSGIAAGLSQQGVSPMPLVYYMWLILNS